MIGRRSQDLKGIQRVSYDCNMALSSLAKICKNVDKVKDEKLRISEYECVRYNVIFQNICLVVLINIY